MLLRDKAISRSQIKHLMKGRNKPMKIFVFISFILMIAAEILSAQGASDYFPLHVGDFWVQRADTISGVYQPMTLRTDIEGTDLIGGDEYFRIKTRLTADDGSFEEDWYSWLQVDSSGIVMGGFGAAPDIFEIEIQTASITVDGDPGDWSGINALATDPQGDDSPSYTGDDIKGLYVAKDSDDLYLRMDLWENANTSFGNGPAPEAGRYAFSIENNGPYGHMYPGVAYDDSLSQWSLGHNGSSSDVPPGLEGPGFVGVSGGVIELRVPLVLVGDPSIYFGITGQVENCCVEDFVVLDEAGLESSRIFDPPLLWVPNEIVNVGYTWEVDSPEFGTHWEHSVESISETVQVAAGTFHDCIKVRSTATDLSGDTTEISYQYYALGVGEVLTVTVFSEDETGRFELVEFSVLTSAEEERSTEIPDQFILQQNYPNPFNPSTTIAFSLPRSGYVTLIVYNTLGEEMATLLSESLSAAKHSVEWDASGFSTGIYFYRLKTGKFVEMKKLVLLK